MVALLALGLAIDNLAARDNTLIPLMWAQAALPGIVCAWLLLGPHLLPSDGERCRIPVPRAN